MGANRHATLSLHSGRLYWTETPCCWFYHSCRPHLYRYKQKEERFLFLLKISLWFCHINTKKMAENSMKKRGNYKWLSLQANLKSYQWEKVVQFLQKLQVIRKCRNLQSEVFSKERDEIKSQGKELIILIYSEFKLGLIL